MLTRRILTLSIMLTVVSGYLFFFEHLSGFAWGLGIGLMCILFAYIFQHQINWWWYRRFPPGIPPEIEKMYTQAGPGFADLDDQARDAFRSRARLFVEAKEFIAQGFDKLAEDVKYMIAYYAVLVTLQRGDFLFKPYDRVVVYLHPFLSPHYPDQIHTCETEHEDGTIILSMEQLTAGFMRPSEFYQTGLHVFAELYTKKYLADIRIEDPDTVWAELREVSDLSREQTDSFIGIPQENPVPVMIHHWFAHHKVMQQKAPGMYKQVGSWLGVAGEELFHK